MLLRKLQIVVILFTATSLLCLRSIFAEDKDKPAITITFFNTYDDFAQCDTFKIKQPIIFYVLWDIPEGIILNGEAVLTVEGEQIDGRKWIISDRKALMPNFPSHRWGWDCTKNIPKKAQPGSIGTATVELSVDGYETIKKTLNFSIQK